MNLLFTATTYPPAVGGAQLLMHQLARQLGERHSVVVLTHWATRRTDWLLGTTLRAPRDETAYVVDGVQVRTVNVPPRGRWRLAPWVGAYWALPGPAGRRIAEAMAGPLETAAGHPDLVHNVRIGREGLTLASLALARKRRVPFVLTPVHHPRWGTWLHREYHRLYRSADAVIALTEAERRTLVQLGVDEGRVHVTGMGPVLAEEGRGDRFRDRHGLGEDPVVLFLAQKYAYKGAALLLRAAREVWARHPRARFAFVGPRTAHSRRLFHGLVEPRVLELDAVDLAEKTDALAACDVLCLPSTQESFGGVFTEAWSFGKPVVGCDIPAVRAVIDDGEDGLLCPPEPGAIAGALDALLSDPARRDALGARGRAKVSRLYTWPRLAERTEAAYRAAREGGR